MAERHPQASSVPDRFLAQVPPPQQMTGVALMSQFFFTDSMNCDKMTYLPFENIFIFNVL